MNVLDLFSGIGAFSLAAERTGMNVIAHSEVDKNCQKLLANKFPASRQLGDICNVKKEDITESIDLIAGGSPCQNLSIAGRGEGLAGAESRLWFEQLRLVKELKPRWVVWENVPNALSTNGGRDFLEILRGLDECGYHVAWRIFDAQYFGVPQRRRRIFLVASLGDGSCAQVLFERESLPGTPRTKPGTWQTTPLAPTLAASASGTARTAGRQQNEKDFLIWNKERTNQFAESRAKTVASTVLARDKKDFGDLVATLDCRNQVLNHNISGTLQSKSNGGYSLNFINPVLSFNTSFYLRGFGSELHEAEVANTLQANKGRGFAATDEVILSFSPATYKRPIENNPLKATNVASTLRAKNGAGSTDSDEQIVVSQMIRRFTPLECERLMGFPDAWTEGFSDTVRYSMLGNSIVVSVLMWIFMRIQAVEYERGLKGESYA
jgi:DNA (cytosine-5)-methyltransferase 1